jgi:hypothetical protein
MYKVRFTNNEGKVIITTIANEKDLNKIIKKEAKHAVIDSRISDNMPVLLYNAIVEHNSKVQKTKNI